MNSRHYTPGGGSAKVKASATDPAPGYLDGKVDNVTIRVTSNKLEVMAVPILTTFAMKSADLTVWDITISNDGSFTRTPRS